MESDTENLSVKGSDSPVVTDINDNKPDMQETSISELQKTPETLHVSPQQSEVHDSLDSKTSAPIAEDPKDVDIEMKSPGPEGDTTPKTASAKQSPRDIIEKESPKELTSVATEEIAQFKSPGPDDDDIPNNASNSTGSLVLSPPPDTSSDSEVVIEGPEDEIVVGSVNAKSSKPITAVVPQQDGSGDVVPMDVDDVPNEAEKETEQRPKRKRASVFDDLAEEKMDQSLMADTTDDFADPAVSAVQPKDIRPAQGVPSVKPVILGTWRESEAPDPDKHVVKGFIDSRDRLRTRIQPHNREGQAITDRWPLKPGPGGSWVTFHNIIFDNHLVHLDQHQVKEYVKIRTELLAKDPEQDPKANDKLAVQQAIKTCQNRGPPPEGALPPLIAYGAEIPEHARIVHPRSDKRRRTAVAPSTGPPVLASQPIQLVQPPPEAAPAELPGHRPTKILLGFWKYSSEKLDEDKHAVFGILGNNDMFRVKVGRETRDGRPVQGNFPQGAGALWINAADWVAESYLHGLAREELKEYSRVRQSQIDQGEREADKEANIQSAVREAISRARFITSKSKPNGSAVANHYSNTGAAGDVPPYETRPPRRSGPSVAPASSRQSPQTPGFRAANRSGGVDPRLERANNLAMRAVSHIEANQAKVEQRESLMSVPHVPNDAVADSFRENIGRLNNVWSQQEAHRIRIGGEDAKIHMGIKYERKTNGPFQGKLVSQGAIISIDGEDYVEYRVLTKPTFI